MNHHCRFSSSFLLLGRAFLPLAILTLAAMAILTASDHSDAPIGPAGPQRATESSTGRTIGRLCATN